MSDLRTAAKQVLEAWDGGDTEWFKRAYTVMENIRAALAEPFSPEAISTTQTAWKMGYEAGKAERVEQSFEQAGVITSMVKGGVTWHIWPDQMPDGTTLYAAAPIIKPEIKEDKPFGYFRAEPFGWTDCAPTDEGAIPLYDRPQAQQFLYNAWADEQIQKEKK